MNTICAYVASTTLIILGLTSLFSFVFLIDGILPTALKIDDENDHPKEFIGENAYQYLVNLTAVGPRPYLSLENEAVTTAFLNRTLGKIKDNCNPNQHLTLDFDVLQNVSLLIVKQEGVLEGNSILVNAHFDSVEGSPGVGDNGAFVAITIETLRQMCKESSKPRHGIIYLFEGGEEDGLLGAWAFMQAHKWAKEVKVAVNLDGYGTGGKPVLFRSGTTDLKLLKHYAKVPNPHAHCAGDEILSHGLLGSGTDFSVFNYYGLPGFDLAFYRNAFVYHSKYDNLNNMPMGSIQNGGDKLLALVRSLSQEEDRFEGPESYDKIVYYDIFGLFLISYSIKTALCLNILTVGFSILMFAVALKILNTGTIKNTIKSFGIIFGSMFLILIVSGIISYIFSKIVQQSYPYHKAPWISRYCVTFFLYVMPTVIVSVASTLLLKYTQVSHNVQVQLHLHTARIFWSIILLLGTLMNIRSMYIIFINVLLHTIPFLIIYPLKLKNTVRIWVPIFAACMILPTALLLYLTLLISAVLVPGSNDTPSLETMTAYIAVFLTFLNTIHFVPFVRLLLYEEIFIYGNGDSYNHLESKSKTDEKVVYQVRNEAVSIK